MDLLMTIKESVLNFIYHLSPYIKCFVIRIGLWSILVYTCLKLSFEKLNSRTVFTQCCIALLVTFIIFSIPLSGAGKVNNPFSAFSVFLCFLAMIFLPARIPFWLVPVYGIQILLVKILYGTIFLLFFIQVIVA